MTRLHYHYPLSASYYITLTYNPLSPVPYDLQENETLALNDSYIAAETDNNVQPMLLDIDGPLLAEHNFTFVMTTPVLMPSYLTVHHICETAARLLFLSIHWTRQVSTFPILSLVLGSMLAVVGDLT